MQVTNDWARTLRVNERETCLSMFLLAMESEGLGDDVIERVKRRIEALYAVLDPVLPEETP